MGGPEGSSAEDDDGGMPRGGAAARGRGPAPALEAMAPRRAASDASESSRVMIHFFVSLPPFVLFPHDARLAEPLLPPARRGPVLSSRARARRARRRASKQRCFVVAADQCAARPRSRPLPPARLLQARRASAGRPIWETTNYDSVLARTRRALASTDPPRADAAAQALAAAQREAVAAATAALAGGARRERSTLAEVVAKKREILLVNVSGGASSAL